MIDPDEREVLARIEAWYYEAPDIEPTEEDYRQLDAIEAELRADRAEDR